MVLAPASPGRAESLPVHRAVQYFAVATALRIGGAEELTIATQLQRVF
jgi:hypothetical protein